MGIRCRNYAGLAGITKDYERVREFLVCLGYCEFTYARWDWMATHGYLVKNFLKNIGIWEDAGKIVGVVTFDTRPGSSFCLTLPAYAYLKKEMLAYAGEHLSGEGDFGVIIPDRDDGFERIAAQAGYVASEEKECDAVFYPEQTSTEYVLPEGFSVTDMKKTYDLYRYRRVLWKGFNHEIDGEGPFIFTEKDEEESRAEMLRPYLDLSLKVAVVSPDGSFVSYCGMWYDPHAGFAVIEPVATDPDYRRMGLGKAAVLEGIRRVGALGAKTVFVGSSQQFYYSIGMRPYATATKWIVKR